MPARKSILIVEDEGIVAKDLQRDLADLGYEVPVVAATSEDALRSASSRCPDLALMDVHIRGPRDGIETASLLRTRFHVPVIFLTALADEQTLERVLTTEPYGYLTKPVQ